MHGLVGERQGRRLWGPLERQVRSGNALHVQGQNGSGKTTLLRTLAGLRRPVAGRVATRAALWYIGHQTPLSDELDAARNLRFWFDQAGSAEVTDTAITDWLEAWPLPRHRPLRQCSAGQRRKLALAPLWLAPRPLWLLDEPFDALDRTACTVLADAARRHLAQGGAMVLSSHQTLPEGFPTCEALVIGNAA